MVTTVPKTRTLVEVFAAEAAGVPVTQIPGHLVGVPLERIVPCRWQPRQMFEPGALLDLANDIAIHGVLTPPLVWENEDGEYELIAGERRVRACYALFMLASAGEYRNRKLESWVDQAAKEGFATWRADVKRLRYAHEQGLPGAPSATALALSEVHCRQIWGTAAELHELALVDNLQRADLSALEEARALQDLVTEYGYSQRDLGRRLGKSQTWISQRLLLLNLAPEVADQVTGGELDSATAREIARLDPTVQPAAVNHLKQFGLKSKAAQQLVQKVVALSQPESLDGVDVNANAERRLAQIALAQLPDEASRQAAVLRYAGQDSGGKLEVPKESHKYRDLIVATGLAGEAVKTRYDMNAAEIWQAQAQAPAAGYACENCRLNSHRETVERMSGLVKAHRDNYAGMPLCAAGVTTCTAFVGEGEELRLPLPNYQLETAITPETQPFVADGYPRRATAVEAWAAIVERYYELQAKAQAVRAEREQNGVAKAIGAYIALQEGFGINLEHFLSQPCHRCIFRRDGDEGAQCQVQITPPQLGSWDNVVTRTWLSGNTTIGRCRFFRLRAPQHTLPSLPGVGAGLSPEAALHLLEQLTPGGDYSGGKRAPHWLDAKRADGQTGPAWGEAESVLQKLLPALEPGQRLAMLYLWTARFHFGRDSYRGPIKVEAFVPDQGRVIEYEVGQDFAA
jgi:ParB family chromosome partitioning protein